MVALLLIILVIAVPVALGFRKSRADRAVDRRHFAAFIGFSAALFALGSAILWLITGQIQTPTPTQQASVFVVGVISNISAVAALVCGILSRGAQRVALIAFGIGMQLIYVLGAFSNFGA
jgi:hypothetical protein